MKKEKHSPLRDITIFLLCIIFITIHAPSGTAFAAGPLSLKECLATAISGNPAIADAQLGIRSAEESVNSAQGKHWPRLTMDGFYVSRQDQLPFIPAQSAKIQPRFSNEFAQLGMTLSLPLYQGGQVSNGVSLSQIRMEIQEQAARQTRYEIMANAINTYNKILQLERLREASQASVDALEEQVKNTRLLLDVGRIARVDLLKVEVQAANEKQRLLAIQEGLKTASATLVYLMGKSPQDNERVPQLSDRLAVPDFDGNMTGGISMARERRPEYLATRKGVEEAEFSRKIATGKLLPTISAYAGYIDQFSINPWYKEGNWQTGLALSIPLFDRSLHADVSRERIQAERARQRLASVENQISLEVGNAVSAIEESRNRVTASEKAVVQSDESFRIEQQKYSSGAGAMVDLLLAQAAAVNSAANYAQALFDYNAALVAYRRATGTMEDYLK